MSAFNELKELTKDIKILYVEDEESVREQTKMMFDLFFDKVDVAVDGEEGLKKYQNGNYDIVFTDISMPKIDGLKLTEKIKEINPNQKVVIISAYNTSDYLLRAIELNVDGFILKPVNINQFTSTIKKVAESVLATKFMKEYQKRLEEEVEKKTEIIKKQLVIDNLTNLKNRYAFNQYVNSESAKSIILLNIDNFESINTIYGYEVGNKVLKTIANRLKDLSIIILVTSGKKPVILLTSIK